MSKLLAPLIAPLVVFIASCANSRDLSRKELLEENAEVAARLGLRAGPPTAEELAAADYGPPITQEAAVAQALTWLQGNLKDPDSLKATWEDVRRGWIQYWVGEQLFFGYVLTGSINAKNSYGGYSGPREFRFVFYGGKLRDVFGMDSRSSRLEKFL